MADADRLIAFNAFDGDVLVEDRNENGRVRHARVRIGDLIVMLNEANDDHAASESQVHLFVDDVDARFTRVLQEGASTLMEPNDRPHGDRTAGFRDPCANTWWIARRG
ncbi:VOC family protein [Ilumatobacter sp.]|uniref:VOC family protein n=1 Tax=Ilumatobacter sp. TaxID=1967498 RepID=UPI003C794A8D